jgi:pSer/pThr/pTyr-binding forkhead associated (FHA) protein
VRLIVLKNHVPINEVLVETPDISERYEIYVGRSEDCHVILEDPLISRHHFVLKNIEDKWSCEKLTQLGVVSINGNSASQIEVCEGDEIRCGPYTVIVNGLPRKEVQSAQTSAAVAPVMIQQPSIVDSIVEEIESKSDADDLEETEISADSSLASSEDLLSEEALITEDSNEAAQEEFENQVLAEEEDFGAELTESVVEGDFPSEESDFSGENASEVALTDEGFGVEESNDDFGESTRVFKAFVNYQLVLFGDHAPYDRYQIDKEEIFIGRDPKKCQIVLDDPEVSTVHAVIRKNNIDIIIEDLNSSNGTILNGERINKSQLSTGDEFVIGSTSFTLETKSDLLDAESDRLMPVEHGQEIEVEEIEEEIVHMDESGETDFSSEAAPEKSLIKRIWKDPVKRKKAIYITTVLVLAYVFLSDPEAPPVPKQQPATTATVVESSATKDDQPKAQLSRELEEKRNMAYELGVSFFDQTKYFEALKEFQTVMEIDPNYKKVDTYLEQTKIGLKRLEEIEVQKRAEEERIKTKKIIEELVAKAREAVKERQVTVAENYFAQVAEKDPENIEIQQLKMELEAWQKEEERKAMEKATKEAARKAMVDALSPGKTFYLKKEWYKSILKLEEFLRRKGSDEDLVKEASTMLSDAKNQLASDLGPLVGKARSLKEGQDLRSAYEAYLNVLKVEPTHSEALNEIDDIRFQLDTRSKKIYREAIIAESLSLFNDAREKFQEVQQISPTDSEYYRKASEKLKNYLE